MIRAAVVADAAAICAIYNPYIASTVITFEETPVTAETMAQRIEELTKQHLWYVAERAGEVAAYAYAGPWRTRSAYRYAVETSVYVAPAHARAGLGRALYEVLLATLEQRGFHTAMGGIALPNDASVALHEALGFRKVAHFAEVGWKLGRWVDVGYWQRTFGPRGD